MMRLFALLETLPAISRMNSVVSRSSQMTWSTSSVRKSLAVLSMSPGSWNAMTGAFFASRFASISFHCSSSMARSLTKCLARCPMDTVLMMMPMPSGTWSFCMILRSLWRSLGSSIFLDIPNCSENGMRTR